MRKASGTLAFTFLISGLVWAGGTPINVQTKKDGKQSITTLSPVKTPATQGGALPEGDARGTVLQAKNWQCGQQFTDQENRVWKLAYGSPVKEKSDNVAGWVITPRSGQLYFFTTGGSLFRHAGKG